MKGTALPEEKISQKTVVAQVMEKIKELITSGLYKVGDRLPTEQELAERFGIGRSSIREAIKIFQYLGIIEAKVPKGTFLRDRSQISAEALTWSILLGNDDMWEIIELREVIEERAFRNLARGYAAKAPAADEAVRALQHEIENMRLAVSESSIDKLIQADYNFHAVIIRTGGSGLFWSIYETLHAFMELEIRKTYQAMKDLSEVSRDHQEIVDAILSRDIGGAAERHGAHFTRIKDLLDPSASTGLGSLSDHPHR